MLCTESVLATQSPKERSAGKLHNPKCNCYQWDWNYLKSELH